MKIALPAQNVAIQTPQREIDPDWFQKLKQIETWLNSGALGQGALATNATSGFAYLPTCAGAPTGIPVAVPGFVPMVFDTTNRKIWIYTGGAWRGVVVA